MPPLNLNDAEQIRVMIVDPTVDAFEARLGARIAALEAANTSNNARLNNLESNQRKGMVGYAIFALIGGTFGGGVLTWIKAKLFH